MINIQDILQNTKKHNSLTCTIEVVMYFFSNYKHIVTNNGLTIYLCGDSYWNGVICLQVVCGIKGLTYKAYICLVKIKKLSIKSLMSFSGSSCILSQVCL